MSSVGTGRGTGLMSESQIPPGWKLLAGTPAKLQAIEQSMMRREQNFDAVLVLPPGSTGPVRIAVDGRIRCHGCHEQFPFARDIFVGAGTCSGKVRCPCGSEITVMDCDARTGGGTFVVVTPFASIRGQDVRRIDFDVTAIRLHQAS